MADDASQLEAYKAAAINDREQLRGASTNDEAKTIALRAAENLMKAHRLSSNKYEKQNLKAQFDEMLAVADRARKNLIRRPIVQQQTPEVNVDQTGQLMASVSISGPSQPRLNDALETPGGISVSASSVIDLVDDHFSPAATQKPSIFTGAAHKGGPARHGQDPNVGSMSGYDKSLGHSATETQSQVRHQDDLSNEVPKTTPSVAPYSHIHRLNEPVSSRKRSKKEDIILLKASMVNNCKCPPWDKDPSTDEFVSRAGAEGFTDTRELSLSPYQQQFFKGWVPARFALPPHSISGDGSEGVGPVMSSTGSIDLVQDAASDCSVVASLCAGIARAERGHDQMLSNKLFPYDKQLGKPVTSRNGKYVVRLNFNGCWRKVVIDDRLPVSSTHRLLHVLDRRNPALLWPALLEKAYLKVRGGYDFPGSNSCSDLWTLTGWIPEQVFLQETDTIPSKLWGRIYNAFTYGDVLVTVGTGKMSSRQERELGLEGQHSYVVLDMKETDQDRLLLIKNPWVEGKGWRGPRPSAVVAMDNLSPNSGTTSSILDSFHRDSVPTAERPHPTTFWIGLEQVIQHFESLYLNWNPGLFSYRQDIHFEWNLHFPSPGLSIVNHPQFSFTSRKAGVVWFLLSRHFRDSPVETKEASDTFNDGSIVPDSQLNVSSEPPKGYMSIYICDGSGERLYIKDTCLASSDYVSTPQCLLRWDAQANTSYTVVIDEDDLPPSPYTFTLSAFSNSMIGLEPASPRFPFQKVEEGRWTRQTAGGDVSSPKYFENPQWSLEVKQRTSLAMLVTSTDHEHPLHVKLALGFGKRLYRLQSRDVLTDSGQYRTGSVFAEIEDLQPGLYTIICSLYEPGHTGTYTMRIDSMNDVVLKQLPRDGAGLLPMKLGPACFGAKVNKVAAPLVPHRLASFTIIARFIRATSPRSLDLGKLGRSPLRLSVELGRGPERKFLVASEQGEYADLPTIRSDSINIDPHVAMGNDVWIVLDRLSGPGGPVEEWYDVEIFTDVPRACSVGVWRDWND